ncbi:hypothetical protein ACIOD2_04870 [Amycolatopsis sp. NPDC088138]|uniref:hypothetical protein n=1 Tax=Amycolatopsis sp. NPDC088138 TaxID=3363938 RepID=UPI0037F2F2E0
MDLDTHYLRTRELLRRFLPCHARILDVGGGTGGARRVARRGGLHRHRRLRRRGPA